VPLAEGMKAPESWWGEQTADELVLARMWLGQVEYFPAIVRDEAWLHEGTQTTRYDSLADALGAWLDAVPTVPLLGAPPDGDTGPDNLVGALADLAARSDRPVLVQDGREWLMPPIVDADRDAQRRLTGAGRIVTLVTHPHLVPTTRSIVTLAVPPEPLTNAVRASDSPAALRAIAEFVEPSDAGYAAKLLEQAAEGGDARAIGRLVQRGDASVDRLLATGDWPVIVRTAEALPGDSGDELLVAGVEVGSVEAIVSLLRRRPGDELADKLIATGDWDAVRRAADDSELGRRMLGAAADAGDAEALKRLVLGGETARDDALKDAADSLTLWQTAVALDEGGEDARALDFHRVAADKDDVDSMLEVVVRGAEDESRAMQAKLAERGDWWRLGKAADRLEGERAAELRALIEQPA
jgi:hypothetical protein